MAFNFANQLKGNRLVLRRTKPTLKMAEIMFKEVDYNRNHLEPWFPWPKSTLKVEDSLKYLFDNEEKTKQGERVQYGIFIKSEYIGNISIFAINEKKHSAELGYWLSHSHIRNGYMTEAVQILEKYAFEKLNINRVQIRCDERNLASIGVAKKCNYQYEGKLREDAFSDYFNDFRNTLIFSKLKSEYKAQSKSL
jgi:ribosomal-protein-serine acetyltransferase